jgi:hypothetical protein
MTCARIISASDGELQRISSELDILMIKLAEMRQRNGNGNRTGVGLEKGTGPDIVSENSNIVDSSDAVVTETLTWNSVTRAAVASVGNNSDRAQMKFPPLISLLSDEVYVIDANDPETEGNPSSNQNGKMAVNFISKDSERRAYANIVDILMQEKNRYKTLMEEIAEMDSEGINKRMMMVKSLQQAYCDTLSDGIQWAKNNLDSL